MKLNFIVLKDVFAIYRLSNNSPIPGWIDDSGFYSVTRTSDELSVVCKQVSPGIDIVEANKDWKAFKIVGLLDFSMVGVIAEVSRILKENNISIFTISTFDTDYILVKNHNLTKAIGALINGGHTVTSEE